MPRRPDLPAAPACGDLDSLLAEIRACRACADALPLGPRPVLQAGAGASILVVGQAPGARVHASGIPWDDASGARLRQWMGVDDSVFYDASRIALVPMGFCYPGRGKSGDLPPRSECAPLWLDTLLARLPGIRLTLLLGQYAQRRFLGRAARASLTETVAACADYGPGCMPLPHPSPRNQGWFQHHPWFARDLLPVLRERVQAALAAHSAPAPQGIQAVREAKASITRAE